MPVCPLDPVADAYIAVDDFQNLSLSRHRADLKGVDDDMVAPPGFHRPR